MIPRRLGSTGILLCPIGFGAFKIGRNEGIKYDRGYDLPTLDETARLLHGILDLGVTWIDTAPAYGVSEERIGQTIAARRREYTLSTKVGETFADGRSTYDFSHRAVRESVSRSLERLKTDVVEIVFVHSDGRDVEILETGETTAALREARASGYVRRLGFSGKTEAGFLRAMDDGYEVLMVERHPRDVSMDRVIAEAARRGVGVVIKKPLASGAVPPATAIPFGLAHAGVASLAIGGLSLERFREHVALAAEL
ncbi:MAG: aldo/keto reductase [Phycisphaerae bacterium]|nr:aldo/keto reductase [Phycisphaerae bacterium]